MKRLVKSTTANKKKIMFKFENNSHIKKKTIFDLFLFTGTYKIIGIELASFNCNLNKYAYYFKENKNGLTVRSYSTLLQKLGSLQNVSYKRRGA